MSENTRRWGGKYLEVHQAGSWEYVTRTRNIGAAVVLALTDSDEIVLVEQFRVPLGCHCIELPAGLIGDETAGEDPAIGAARELYEETGFEADAWQSLGVFATSPGMSSETFSLFAARKLRRTGPGGGTPGEGITVHVVARANLSIWCAAKRAEGCAIDSRLMVALGFV